MNYCNFFWLESIVDQSLHVVKINRPLQSSKNPHFQNEAKCTTFLVKMSFICMRMKNHFHMKGWALNLVLIQRPGDTFETTVELTSFGSTLIDIKFATWKVQHLNWAWVLWTCEIYLGCPLYKCEVPEFIGTAREQSCFFSCKVT